MFSTYMCIKIYLLSCIIYFVLSLFFAGKMQLIRIYSQIDHVNFNGYQVKFLMIYRTLKYLIRNAYMCLFWPIIEILGYIAYNIMSEYKPNNVKSS